MDDLTKLTAEALTALADEKRTALAALVALESPTDEQVTEAESLAADLDAVEAEQTGRVDAATKKAERMAALKAKVEASAGDNEGGDDDDAADDADDDADDADDDAADDAADADDDAATQAKGKTVKAKVKSVQTLSKRVNRPAPPAVEAGGPIAITAAADVPQFSTGQALTMDDVVSATINRMRGFGTPSGDGRSENLQHYGVASFKMDFPEDLVIDRHTDDMEVLAHAARESRLPGESLVAANGWCAPSETLYDLCTTETTEGILSVPEVDVKRGGIKFTSGPDFSTIYSNVGFQQTEAQAISGTTKTCFEVPCPSFTDVRLDAIGICIKAPILTNSAYPELVRRWLDGSMIAHQHKVNASVIASMVTAAGAARVFTGLGTAAGDTLDAVELVVESLREKYRMGLTATMEVVLPNWVKGVLRADLSKRSGLATEQVTDQVIAAHFSTRHSQVQFVYDWNMLPTPDTVIAYPVTFQALIYPAGTFVKGTSDVITLNAVYDAASLATNLYTALFFEQGLLVAKMCNQAALVTIPNVLATAMSGKTGANSL